MYANSHGEHGDRCTSLPFRANAAERSVVPHVAADTDNIPRRGGRQVHTRPDALVRRSAAAPERNATQPDGVRLTPARACRQVEHEAIA